MPSVETLDSTKTKQDIPDWLRKMRKVLIWALALTTLSIPGSSLMGRFDLLMLCAIWVAIVTPIIALIATIYFIAWLSTCRKYSHNYAWWSTVLLILSVTTVLGITAWIISLWASMGNIA